MSNIKGINETEDIDDGLDVEFDFTEAIRNPFINKLKNGYTVTVRYEADDEYTLEDLIGDEVDKIKFLIYEKVKELPRGEQLNDKLDKIYEAIENC